MHRCVYDLLGNRLWNPEHCAYWEAFSGRITSAIFESVVLASEAVFCWLSQLEYLLYDTVLLTWIEGRSFLH